MLHTSEAPPVVVTTVVTRAGVPPLQKIWIGINRVLPMETEWAPVLTTSDVAPGIAVASFW
jgi:hypothetical protein